MTENRTKLDEEAAVAIPAADNTAVYAQAAMSDNTRQAYKSDIKQFLAKGYSLPTTVEQLQCYMKECAAEHNPRTISRRLIALRQWHRLQKQPDPTSDPAIRQLLRGISRIHGQPKRKAPALPMTDIERLMAYLLEEGNLIALRDRALILLGFYGAFRRSELVRLQWSNVQFVSDGVLIQLPRSKTDQIGKGAICSLPYSPEPICCLVQALLAWKNASLPSKGAIF